MADATRRIEPTPCQADLVEGQTYEWCTCGLSKTRPFCDQSHIGTDCVPVRFVARHTETALLCGCLETGDPPYCDGTHNTM